MTETTEPVVLDLLEEVSPDDGYTAFFRREFGPARRVVEVIVGDRARAQAVTLDAFTEAWRRWDKVGRRDEPGAWVRRVAVRRAMAALAPGEVLGRVLDDPEARNEPGGPEATASPAALAPADDLDLATLDRLEAEVRERAARDVRRRRRQLAVGALALLVVIALVAAVSGRSGQHPAKAQAAAPPTAVAPLPAGRLLVADQDGSLVLRSARSGAGPRQVVAADASRTIASLSTTADGRRAYVSWDDQSSGAEAPSEGGLFEVSLVTGAHLEQVISPSIAPVPGTPLAVSPDGRHLAYVPAGAGSRFQVAVVDLRTGHVQIWAEPARAAPGTTTGRRLEFGPADIVSETVTWLAWSPDGRHVAVSYDTAIVGADPAARSIEILDTAQPAGAANPRPVDPEAPYDRTISWDGVYQGPDRLTALYGCPSVDYCPLTSPLLSSVDPATGRHLVPPTTDGAHAGSIVSNLTSGPGQVVYATQLDCTDCPGGPTWAIDVLDATGARQVASGPADRSGDLAADRPVLVAWVP